uniref:HDC16037 n=1 Tax=Drosophila melanogaster TaxID=7227 RepID=Q6IJ36_DROME|nr:TPA_inf: HDC16037 [Drosophila melanogaster]
MSATLRLAVFALLLFYQGSALFLEQNCGKSSVFSPAPWLVKIRPELSSNITCTGTLINELGWPLTKQINESALFHQYGILSHRNSESKKDVYTDVMAYVNWITPLALDVHITMAPNTDFDF